MNIKEVFNYSVKEFSEGVATYECSVVPDLTGAFQMAVRMYAKNPLLAHKQDIELVKWL